jgi:transcriptional regulator with XRE-family HTH domain
MVDPVIVKAKKVGRPAAPNSNSIRLIRLELGLTQEDFARKIGCTTAAVRKAEFNRKLFAHPGYMNRLRTLAQKAGLEITTEQRQS